MNIAHKLPIGLSLACLMAMSSCSKEDVQNPAPETASERTEANMRGIDENVLDNVPTVATTDSPSGKNKFAEFWQRDDAAGSQDLQALPAGTSTVNALWGDPAKPFVAPLPKLPNMATRGILSVTTNTTSTLVSGAKSIGRTTIKNLQPGKKYEVKYYVASTVPEFTDQGYNTNFANKARVSIRYANPDYGVQTLSVTDLESKQGQWIPVTATFTAYATQVDFLFSASTKNAGSWAYAHLYVNNYSVKKVN